MIFLRLWRSASTPPSGASRPMGKKASTYMSDSAIGEPVVSVMYQTPE